MSVAGLWHVYLFPDEIPINIASPEDLKRLSDLFPGRELYLVAGSDVHPPRLGLPVRAPRLSGLL